MNNLRWLTLVFLAVLSGALFLQNVRLSRSVEALEVQVESLRAVELVPAPERVTQMAPGVEVMVSKQSPQANTSPDDDGLVDEQRRQADFMQAFTSGILATGTLTSTIDNLQRQFAEEFVDPEWSEQQEIRIQTEFVNTESLLSYQLSNLECRSTMCKGLVQTFDKQPFESDGVSLAVALSAFESIDLTKMQIQSRDAAYAQVYFAKKNLTDE